MEWLPVRNLVRKLDISDPTLRRYVKDHNEFIRTKKEAKMLMIHQESIPVLEKIREWYAKGLRFNQVDEKLRTEFSLSIVISNDDEKGELTVKQTLENMDKLQQVVTKMIEENRKLHLEIDDLRQSIEKRDTQQQETLDEIVEHLKSDKNKGLLRRFFGK